MFRSPVSARPRNERGTVAILVAFGLVALLTVSGLVLDLGLAREQKVTNRSYTDAAALAGIHAADAGDQTEKPFVGVCAALSYLQVNDPVFASAAGTWRYGNGTAISGNPCATGSAMLNAICTPGDSSTWAWYTGTSATAGVTVDIKSGYVTPDPAFDKGTSGDNSDQGGCDQLAVIITQSDDPGVGQVARAGAIVTKVRSVARAVLNNTTAVATGLLVLERHACNALQTTGAASIHVMGSGTTGGSIQVDSLGDTCLPGQKVISATISTVIKAHKAESGSQPGTITTTALSATTGAVPGNASSGPPTVCAEQADGTCLDATGGPVVGRGPIDRRYLGSVRAAMTAAAIQYSKGSSPGSTAAGVPYSAVFSCTNITSSSATAIFVNCPTGATIGSTNKVSFPNATDVVFNGPLLITNSGGLSLPKGARLYIKGGVGNGLALTGSGYLYLNQGSASTCAGYSPSQAAQLVIGNGAFYDSNSGVVRLCGTTVLMADGFQGACPLPTSAAGTGQAPYDNLCGGSINLTGAGITDWTAPNLYPGTKAPLGAGLEDLALWTETSVGNVIGNSGNQQVTGVYFLPNASPFSISGAGNSTIGTNAQFIARRLVVTNSGALYLRPNSVDTVPIPLPDSFYLVR